MKNGRAFLLVVLAIWLCVSVRPAYSWQTVKNRPLVLKSGTMIECDVIWEGIGGYVWYQRSFGIVGYPFTDVDLVKTFGAITGEVIAKRYAEKLSTRNTGPMAVRVRSMQKGQSGYDRPNSNAPGKTKKGNNTSGAAGSIIVPREPNR